MENEYIPAIITAAAGIVGIFLNIAVNAFYRIRDINDKRRERKIESLETYYLPLCTKMQTISNLILTFEKESKEKLDMEKLTNYFNESNKSPVPQRKIVEEIKSHIVEVSEIIKPDQQHFLDDFKIRFYYDKIHLAFNIFKQAIDNHSQYQNVNFQLKYIQYFIDRINYMTIAIYSKNIFHKLYLQFWMYKVQSK